MEFVVNVYDPEPAAPPDNSNLMRSREAAAAGAVASVPGGYLVAPLALPLAEWLIKTIEGRNSYKLVLVKITGKVEGAEFGTFVSEYIKGRVTEEDLQAILVKTLDQVIPEVRHAMGGR